ncbi:IS701 family transposase [Chloroflexus sp.]|jgi:SRSO17 transposase|uniref:IS701 family transposase n=1 Tax=Chloroflexus sp. TaxID=1904827 RepID=UPI002ACD93FB|nr:IS701 family transposase [Chloroflexus sp.]
MVTTPRLPHAPSAPLPELEAFLEPLHVHFKRSESRHAMERYLTGLLTEHPNKNCDTLAQVVPGTSEQSLQGLLTNMRWDEHALNNQRVARLHALRTEGDGVLIIDDMGFPKQGNASVGVARQYSGALGKVDNCQVTVNLTYAERTIAWPLATRLYLPEKWANDAARRTKAHVPDEVRFQTKAEIALDLLDWALAEGIPFVAVTSDADYGDQPFFLDQLERRTLRYVMPVRRDFTVRASLERGSERADALIAAQPKRAWQTLSWREGSKGRLRARFVALRCWRQSDSVRWVEGWLIGEVPARGQAGDPRWYWSNFPLETPLARLVEYAHRRHQVERFHQDAKTLLGWDQYQGRRWDGFHRHAVLVMLAYSFLVWSEWQQRAQRGNPGRRAFSPSAGSPTPIPGGGPSAGARLAASACH